VFGISGFELLILMALVLIIFGPDRLPELGRTVGRAMGTFKRAQQDMERVIRAEMWSQDQKSAQAASAAQPVAEEPVQQLGQAASIWAATEEDDEEEDEE
jgi:TatA/E family protein of Tat protein translocase